VAEYQKIPASLVDYLGYWAKNRNMETFRSQHKYNSGELL